MNTTLVHRRTEGTLMDRRPVVFFPAFPTMVSEIRTAVWEALLKWKEASGGKYGQK